MAHLIKEEIRKYKWIEGEKGRKLSWERARQEWTDVYREKFEKFLIDTLYFSDATPEEPPAEGRAKPGDNCNSRMQRDPLGSFSFSTECLVLLGPSGIGKSTLLRLLIKTLNPERGSILFHGADITHLPRTQLNRIRTRIGMVFQSSALVSSMCVSENLALPLRELTTKTEGEIATIVEEKLHFVGLDNAKDLMPSQLSGGMKKRIAVARALVLNPDLILFDEPTTGLDPVAARQVSELIVDLNRKTGATILVVTHDLHSTFLIATRIAVLDQGRIIEEGQPEAIRHSHDPVVAQFLAAGASDGTEADLTRDPHQLTRDDRFQSDEQRRTDQAAFNCALRCS